MEEKVSIQGSKDSKEFSISCKRFRIVGNGWKYSAYPGYYKISCDKPNNSFPASIIISSFNQSSKFEHNTFTSYGTTKSSFN